MEILFHGIVITACITLTGMVRVANVTTIHLKALFTTGKKMLTNLDFQMKILNGYFQN